MKQLLTIILFSTTVISCSIINKSSVKAFSKVKQHDLTFDAIIVPGYPYKDRNWDSLMKARVIWSYVLYKNGIAKNIIYSGSTVYSLFYESLIMGLYAQQLGIPTQHIFYDTLARHSVENVYYSYLIAKEQGFKIVALATDPFQSIFLRNFTSTRLGTPIYHLPFVIDSVWTYSFLTPTIDPAKARKKNFNTSKNKQSVIERVSGAIGGGINWEKHPDKMLPPL